MLEQRCVFLNTKHRRAARDQADTAKIHNFYGSIDATQASSYQCMLNRMFEVLEVHSYFGTIVPHDKSGKSNKFSSLQSKNIIWIVLFY